MKKTVQTCLAAALTAALLCSLSACAVFRNIKENAANAGKTEILESPADDTLDEVYAAALKESAGACDKVTKSVSYSVSDPAVSPGSGTKDTGLLNASAGQLAAMIMKNHPGSEKTELAPADLSGSALALVPEGAYLQTVSSRHIQSEAITDEKGNEQTDEQGETVTREFVGDNLLEITFRFYEAPEEKAEGEPAEEETTAEPARADAAAVEAVFGAPADQAAVLREFEAVKAYLQVEDYTFEYTDCFVTAVVDLELNRLISVHMEKNMAVTAGVLGAGPFAECGSFTITLNVNEATDFSFSYPGEEA